MTTTASPETKGYAFNHTMLRIRDPQSSLKFYGDVLGMRPEVDYAGGVSNC